MGEKEFQVSTAYSGYVFLGWAQGRFEPEQGRKMPYYNMFVLSPVSSFQSEDYKAYGLKAEKKKCLSEKVWEGLEPGDKVRLFFDDKGRIIEAALDELPAAFSLWNVGRRAVVVKTEILGIREAARLPDPRK